jgi:exosortase
MSLSSPSATSLVANGPRTRNGAALWVVLGAVVAAFALPLSRLALFAYGDELSSYILIVPPVAIGLGLMRRRPKGGLEGPWRGFGALSLALSFGLLLVAGLSGYPEVKLQAEVGAFVAAVWATFAWFVDRRELTSLAFPLGFMVLLVPLPSSLASTFEYLLQQASAVVAVWFLELTRMPVFYTGGTAIQLPGIRIEVAPVCSGLHSTLSLLIVSLPVGYLFLRSPMKRFWLAAATVPLGIARNAFRIWVICQLCVRIGPEMIDSYIHRHGGWIFFLASLIPFAAFLAILARSDAKPSSATPSQL